MTIQTDLKDASPDSVPNSSPDSNRTLIERRTFLKTGTLAGAAALAGAADVSRAQSTDSAAVERGATTPVMTAQGGGGTACRRPSHERR